MALGSTIEAQPRGDVVLLKPRKAAPYGGHAAS